MGHRGKCINKLSHQGGMCSDLVITMCDDLYNNVQMLANSVIVKCKLILATLQSIIIKWQH